MMQPQTNHTQSLPAVPQGIIPAQVKPKKEPAQKPLEGVAMAFLPNITKECFPATMGNYRRYRAVYNQEVKVRNKVVTSHNQKVRVFLANCQDKVLLKYAKEFPALNAGLSKARYNALAMECCEKYGPIVLLQKHRTLKNPLQQTFSLLLYIYSLQLKRNTERRLKFPVKSAQQLPPVDVNSYTLSKVECEDGVLSLDFCPETVRNHRQILQEAGVLVNYVYRGSYRGVHLHINPDILVFFDAETEKLTGTENQPFTPASGKDFGDVLVATRSLKEEKKSNRPSSDCVDKVPGHTPAANALHEHLQEPAAAPSLHEHSSTRTPHSATGRATWSNSPGAGAADVPAQQPENPHSNALRALIQEPQDLDRDLRSGKFEGYKPLDFKELEREALENGNLTKEEFIALWVQNMFKYAAATLYKGRTDIYPGAWYNAYTHWTENVFVLPNGTRHNKVNMLGWYREYIWRINWASTWFERESRLAKKQLQPTPPSLYFNSHRKRKECIGFAFTAQKWKVQLEKENPELKLKRQAAKEEQRLKERSSNMRKFDRVMDEYFKHKRSIDGLFQYVENNLPPEYVEKAVLAIQKRAEAVGFKVTIA